MTSYELLAIVEELLAITDPSGYLIATLSKWVADSTKLFELVDATIDQDAQNAINANQSARNIAKDLVERAKEPPAWRIYGDVQTIKQSLETIHNHLIDNESAWLAPYVQTLDQFREAYEKFLKTSRYGALVNLYRVAEFLRNWVGSGRSHLKLIRDNITGPRSMLVDGERRFALEFEGHLGLREMGDKLILLQEVYSAVCEFLGISEQEFPLRADKIESGSWYESVIGSAAALLLAKDIIFEAAKWARRTYTREGKVSQIATDLDAVVYKLLEASERVKAAGLDDAEIRESANRAAVQIARRAVRLVSDAGAVKVDRERVVISEQMDQKQIGGESQKLLEGPAPTNDSPVG